MAQLTPLRALRPGAGAAARVSSVPYDVVSVEEARRLADGNPLSFLRVTRSELELAEDADPYSDAVYERARANLASIKREAPLETEAEPTLYVYRLRMGDHVQSGVAGAYSIAEYEEGLIKRHEKTRRAKEDDRTRHIVTTRAQTGIVFLTYRARGEIDAAVDRIASGEPLYDFVSPDGVRHTLWAAGAGDRDALVAAFGEVPALYIADGHHRAASAWRASREVGAGRAPHPPAEDAGDPDTFLAVAFPDDQVKILPYHRVVADLAGRSAAELVAEIESRFEPVEDAPQPSARGRVSYYLDGRWRSFVLSPADRNEGAAAGLDCRRLQELVLEPLLGIGDPRTDPRIDFVGGIRGTAELERRVDSGSAAIAFALFPVSTEDLFSVSDAGEIMPPKSTWFEPKLRDGLLIQEI